MSLVLFVVLVYVGLQLALGVWVSRRVSSQADYLLGGRSLGLTLCTASMFATWFGAETCVGAAGEVYAHGIGAVSADPFGYGVCLILFGLFVAGELRKRGYTTLADLFGERFSRGIERIVAVMMVPGSVLWAAAQIRAFGGVFSAAAGGLDPTIGIALAAAVTIAYTASGGLLADVYTDLLQGIVLVGTLVVLAAVVFSAVGGLPSLVSASAAQAAPETSRFALLDAWAVPIVGSLFTQEIISRAVASKTPEIARRSALLGGGIYLLLGSIPVLLGLVARQVLPPTDDVEQVLPLLSRHVLGEVGFVLLAGALISAILSTVDSALLACGAFVMQNIIGRRARSVSEAARLRVTRLAVAGLGGVAFVFALLGESVHELVAESSALGSSGIVVAGLFGLFTRFGGPRAALLSVVAGAATYVFAKHALESDIAYLWSLGAALAGYAAGAVLRQGEAAPSGDERADTGGAA
jgi:Na+/proline symporter